MQAMDDLEQSLVWSQSGTEESRLFYESSIRSLAKRYRFKSEEDLAAEIISKVFRWLTFVVKKYGKQGEEELIVVKCQMPKETGGIWAFDIRFVVSGRSSQVLTAARGAKEVGESISKEIAGAVRDTCY